MAVALALHVLRGRADLRTLLARLRGPDAFSRPNGATVLWLHAASNGEVTGARPLIEDALARDPDVLVYVTTNSSTALALVKSWAMARVHVGFAPFDLRRSVTRFLDTVAPDALVVIENEIWPNRFDACAARGIPVLVAGARISATSAKRWSALARLMGSTTRRTLGAITALAAQDAESEQRFLQIGIAPQCLLPRMNLKSTVALDAVDPQTFATLAEVFPRARTLLAASTHDGEEQAVIEAFATVRQAYPDARLILAPRHPDRRAEILTRIEKAGLSVALRSRHDDPAQADVYLADTLGEMALWYQLACATFVGGSLVERGGHTPFEPAQFDTAIVHGPNVSNHAIAYHALDVAQGAVKVNDHAGLSLAWQSLLAHEEQQVALTEAARRALDPLRMSATGYAAFWRALADAARAPRLAVDPRSENLDDM